MKKQKVIKAEHVSKEYRLGQLNRGTLTADLQAWVARKKGLEDPTKTIEDIEWIKRDKFLALNDVSFEIFQGDTVGIIGENGAGKSTLLKILSRITTPTKGVIGYNGRISSMLEVGTGFNGELTGRENIFMNGAILGMNHKSVEEKMEQIIDFSECEKFIDTPVKRYSSGMYVKLAFSVAAHLDSEILIMDEVLAVGDLKFQKKCIKKMQSLANENGRTVIYVSHNMATVSQLCNKCFVLNSGRLKYAGDTQNAINYYINNTITLSTHYLLEKSKRTLESKKVRLLEYIIEKKELCIFSYGEKMYASVKYIALEDADDINLRMEMQYIDGSVVGITTVKLDKIESGKTYIKQLEVDISDFSAGKYQMLVSCWNSTILFSSIPYDAPAEYIYYEINILEQNEPYWDYTLAGHRTMKNIHILEEGR